MFTTLAFNTANEISLEELSQNSGVAKNTIKRYLEYVEAAFLIKLIHRIDRSGKRFRRANFFKVYLTNPSIRAALFSPVHEDEPSFGYLVETAVFSQWFPADDAPLHYARWKNGEVDMVHISSSQKIAWGVEVKWSDSYARNPSKLNNIINFCHHNNLHQLLVTSKSERRSVTYKNTEIVFIPASEYCLTISYNGIQRRQEPANTENNKTES